MSDLLFMGHPERSPIVAAARSTRVEGLLPSLKTLALLSRASEAESRDLRVSSSAKYYRVSEYFSFGFSLAQRKSPLKQKPLEWSNRTTFITPKLVNYQFQPS